MSLESGHTGSERERQVLVDGAESLDVPDDPSAAGRARSFVRTWLRARGLEAVEDSAVLLTSEVVGNAVLHAPGPVCVHVEPVADGVRVSIADSSVAGPTRRRHSAEATTGRGLHLLDDVADDWGWHPCPGGKTVWFVVTTAVDPWTAFTGTDLMSKGQT